MGKIKVAIVGIGNCASALLQGIEYYKHCGGDENRDEGSRMIGLMHDDIGGYKPWDIEVVAAFDIDRRKVGNRLQEALFAPPNCTQVIWRDLPDYGVTVSMGNLLDGVSDHMKQYPPERTFLVADEPPCDVEQTLEKSKAEILLNYLPVGSEEAAQFYATCCYNSGISLVNCMPAFIASNKKWAEKFERKGIPIVGDDIKSQLGATIVHRALAKLFIDRGVKIDKTYQLNVGGNTDFLNMLNFNRLQSKKISKTEAVQSQLDIPLEFENIHIGPSDYIPWQNDNKVCFLRIEGRGFGGIPMNLELRLSVEDSPNSAGASIDAIRCCKLARERSVGGALTSISAYTMKHPLIQIPDHEARVMVEDFIAGKIER